MKLMQEESIFTFTAAAPVLNLEVEAAPVYT